MNTIITIGREFGSGGRELGRRLAEALGIEYYDKEIICQIAQKTSLSEEYVKSVLECRPHHLMPITTGQSITYWDSHAFRQEQEVYGAQNQILKELAEKTSCVIIGRCADYILREYNPFTIFVYADMDSRVRRCIARSPEGENLSPAQMKRYIRRIDSGRSKYYGFYTGQKWGDKLNYDMCINTTDIEIKTIVPVIAKMFEE